MEKMNAIVAYGAGDYRYQEVDQPVAGLGEAVIKIDAAGICASDRAVYRGGDPWGGIDSPRIPGHEIIGTVVELGAGTFEAKKIALGDRVTAECVMPCGRCYYCKKGFYNLCDDESGFLEGGFAEYMKLPERALIHKVPQAIDPVCAALIEPLSCAAYAVDRTGMGMEDTVVISGLGTIGMGMLQFAKLKTPYRVIGLDVNDKLCDIAKTLGADYTFNPGKCDPCEEIRKLTQGIGCDIYMEASGSEASLKTGFYALRKRGKLLIYSVFHKESCVDFNQVSEFKELQIIGGHLSPGAFPYVIQCLERKLINAQIMATDIYKMGDIQKAMNAKDNSKVSIKTVLIP